MDGRDVTTTTTIHALSRERVWHAAEATYPSSADTRCGLRREPCGYFTTRRRETVDRIAHPNTRRCPACFVYTSDV